MAHGDFVWCDLSTRRIDNTCAFYSELFGWQYQIDAAPDSTEYRIAYASNPLAAIYRMPKKFDDMGMPCFWMSYIEVASAASAVDIAKSHGGIVEVGPIDGANGSTIALIRDPLGAGFTVIEGGDLRARTNQAKHGQMARNELYVSDARAVIPFYQTMFGWTIAPSHSDSSSHQVVANGSHVAEIHELPDSVRGKEQFWGVHFAVDDLAIARAVILNHGSILYESDDTFLARDPDDGAFFLTTGQSS